MTIVHDQAGIVVHHGDCLDVLRELADDSVDAVVTDPPYGLEFMGKDWDGADGFRRSLNAADAGRDNAFGRASRTSPEYRAGHLFQEWCALWAAECLRVLKPGGHLLAFGGTRTWHRLAVAVEDAGFEIRDSFAWLYGSGFPKSLDVSKAIDKAAGAEREVVGERFTAKGDGGTGHDFLTSNSRASIVDITAPATPDAERWQGWGTALKPAFEPIVVARKPLAGTVAANVLAHGTGALNIDATRIRLSEKDAEQYRKGKEAWNESRREGRTGQAGQGHSLAAAVTGDSRTGFEPVVVPSGRWPANVVLDESQAAELDAQSGTLSSGANPTRRGSDKSRDAYGEFAGQEECEPARGADSGGASRFFYTAKADAGERVRVNGVAHPTVKPLSIMRWLVRLVTPPGGVVLEPFAGSGTTAEACLLEGFGCVAIEREADYLPLIVQRLNRRLDPVAAVRAADEDAGLFDLLDDEEVTA